MDGLVCSENLYLLFFQQTIEIIKNLFFGAKSAMRVMLVCLQNRNIYNS